MADGPPAVIEMAIEPRNGADRERFLAALAELAAQDPSFRVSTDESGQTIIKGMGELHLDVKVDILRRAHEVEVNVGAPQVAFRETITRRVEVDYTHKRQAGGRGEFARIKLVVEPMAAGSGVVFDRARAGGAVPMAYAAGVEKGVRSVLGSGLVLGFPVVDVKVHLADGVWHGTDSSVEAFETAGRTACREALRKGGSVLLEPIMKVEVVTSEGDAGPVVRDLVSRRGRILGRTMRGEAHVVTAMVPLINMFGYVNHLRSFTRGRASYEMEFDHYEPAPLPPDGHGPHAPAAAMRAV
ncbi:translation elongation factor EF-G [Labrys wisconsinensis]|uniref:Translation elongation factor EF-G n=1 Tax=Labrys wisconsinensis TaxID=425677 RepID=A0ABU0JME6_9HYPH|nr:translation elongation factor EF-G [Labrys wisconsinensis]